MRIKDVPVFPAYLVFHDAYMNGAMDVYPYDCLVEAVKEAERRQLALEENGRDECGHWNAYAKLPRIRVWKFHERKAAQ